MKHYWMMVLKCCPNVLECVSSIMALTMYSQTSIAQTPLGPSKLARDGEFEPMRVDYSGRSGGFIGTFLDFL